MTRRRSLALAALALAFPLMAAAAPVSVSDLQAGHYVLDPHHASLIARVNHMGVSLYTVRFNTLDASLDYDPARPERTRVTASVDPTSLDVNADYSKTFAEEFLQVSKFTRATFVSTGVQPGAGTSGTMTGDLTLMGVTKPVTLRVNLDRNGNGGGRIYANLSFDRRNFGMTRNVPFIRVSDSVRVRLVLFIVAKPAAAGPSP